MSFIGSGSGLNGTFVGHFGELSNGFGIRIGNIGAGGSILGYRGVPTGFRVNLDINTGAKRIVDSIGIDTGLRLTGNRILPKGPCQF